MLSHCFLLLKIDCKIVWQIKYSFDMEKKEKNKKQQFKQQS